MTDQQRIAEIEQRLDLELQIGGFSSRSVRLIEKDIPFLLSLIAAKDAEIERLKAEANADYSEIADTMAGLMGEIERLREAQRWIPVTERLPREDCIIYEANAGRVWFSYAEEVGAADWNITHWMPLPAAPEKGDSRELP